MKEYLSRKGAGYKDFDVATDAKARQEMSEKTGSMAVPTLIINGETVIGFDRNKIDTLLH
ncbi:glutaredoxin domain-containing protein [Phosphitispora sp. TUW77]|uniref:glutaredoxin domain-containing protein n=1 Tax=Phosphitispora sp. TUW77 TaxID=3152361 RepID=UPI003AB5AEB5